MNEDDFNTDVVRFRVWTPFWIIHCRTCEHLYSEVFKLDEHEGHNYYLIDEPKFLIYGKGDVKP